MEESYEEHELACERIREDNAGRLKVFKESLEKAGLSAKTVARHVNNMDFYLNVYLLRYGAIPTSEGIDRVGSFLGDWFIRKCMWSTPASIRQYVASFKKFDKCMLSAGEIDASDYARLEDIIKEEKDDWIEECEAYNNGWDDFDW